MTIRAKAGTDLRSSHGGRRSRGRQVLAATFILLVLGSFHLACSDGDDDNNPEQPVIRHPEDFLPPGTQDMQEDGSPRVATDTAGLQDIVNGGYEIYTTNGFQEMVEQSYEGTVAGTAATIRVWIFDMTETDNATALHDELTRTGAWEEWNEVGDQAHRRTELFAHIIMFRQEQYSVRLDISSSSQEAKDLLSLFATHIDQEITQ